MKNTQIYHKWPFTTEDKKKEHNQEVGGWIMVQLPCPWVDNAQTIITIVEVLPEEWGIWAPHQVSQPRDPVPGWALNIEVEDQWAKSSGRPRGLWEIETLHKGTHKILQTQERN